jgi:hypothetical protein
LPPNQRPLNCSKFIKELDLTRLAGFEGREIRVRFLKDLRASRDKLYSERPHGQPVYAASFIRRREIFLDLELERRPRNLARILVHELFHFAWVRLGNRARASYGSLLKKELRERAGGELGWSAEMRKKRLSARPRLLAKRQAQWRDYVCESFCDTAAWLYAGLRKHSEFTLAGRHRERRAEWFRKTFSGREIPI